MALRRPGSRKRISPAEPEELTARIISYKQNYFVGRVGGSDSCVDDEAAVEVEAVIENTSRRHLKHVGQGICFRLLHSKRYADESAREQTFFGSVTIRGEQRSVLAYLPERPFWSLPELIERGAGVIQCSFGALASGHGDLLSFYLGRSEDLGMGQT